MDCVLSGKLFESQTELGKESSTHYSFNIKQSIQQFSTKVDRLRGA